MATYTEHLSQARKNLNYLLQTNEKLDSCWDWHVTVSFYVGVHLVNAYLAEKANLHYRSHVQVSDALNPYSLSPTKVDESVYLAYKKLQNLSRRSRYLISESPDNEEDRAFGTFDKHFGRSLSHLDTLLKFISSEYQEGFEKMKMKCPGLSKKSLQYFIEP
ncbi:MAG: hypothetical protein WC756_01075 [Taibaiella sp.]